MLAGQQHVQKWMLRLLQLCKAASRDMAWRLNENTAVSLEQPDAFLHGLDGLRQVLKHVHERDDVEGAGRKVFFFDRSAQYGHSERRRGELTYPRAQLDSGRVVARLVQQGQ